MFPEVHTAHPIALLTVKNSLEFVDEFSIADILRNRDERDHKVITSDLWVSCFVLTELSKGTMFGIHAPSFYFLSFHRSWNTFWLTGLILKTCWKLSLSGSFSSCARLGNVNICYWAQVLYSQLLSRENVRACRVTWVLHDTWPSMYSVLIVAFFMSSLHSGDKFTNADRL